MWHIWERKYACKFWLIYDLFKYVISSVSPLLPFEDFMSVHVQRMDTIRRPKQALQYKPKRRRHIGRPGRDGGTNFILRIKEQESNLILPEHDDDDD
jgi:hypothetical protein